MTEQPSAREERQAQLQIQDARRLLSRQYLEEVDRRNEEFLATPDDRPNSGLREGDVSHAQVNTIIRNSEKTVIFGQQTRLRAGILMKEDERLPRFHAGHDVVNYFYRAIRLIPDYLLDAMFARGISVTMVKGRDLLYFSDSRCHQSFHMGRTRRTIYLPEGVLMAAYEAGYHPWAFSEILLQEAWKLLDYYLVVELARHTQTWMHSHFGIPGYYWMKDTLLSLNKHRRIAGEREQAVRKRFRRNSKRGLRRQTKQYDEYDATSTDTEFMQFYRHYFWDFYGWDRPGRENRGGEDSPMFDRGQVQTSDILLQDPYHVGNETFDERRESAWGVLKIDAIKDAFDHPDEYLVDRDIVHRIAFDQAKSRGMLLEPETVEDFIHDLRDVSRFGVDRQARSDGLMECMVEAGLPGITAFYDAVAEEHALGKPYITYVGDDIDLMTDFKSMIQGRSSTGPEGTPNSVSNDVRDYVAIRLLRQIGDELDGFLRLPKRERLEGRWFLRALTLKALQLARPDLDEADREEMVAAPVNFDGPSHHVSKLADVAGGVLRRLPEDRETDLLFDMLRKMDIHDHYDDVLLAQARTLRGDVELDWSNNQRGLVNDLRGLIPEAAHTVSSDPAGVRARLNRFDYLQRQSSDHDTLLALLAGVLIRLDRSDAYPEMLSRLPSVGEPAVAELQELTRIDDREVHRLKIREGAIAVLQKMKQRQG